LADHRRHRATPDRDCDQTRHFHEALRGDDGTSQRDPFSTGTSADDQAHAFTASALPAGAKLWSKAGWTSQTRHDAAYVELPTGQKFVLVTFTVDHANEREIIPSLRGRSSRA